MAQFPGMFSTVIYSQSFYIYLTIIMEKEDYKKEGHNTEQYYSSRGKT